MAGAPPTASGSNSNGGPPAQSVLSLSTMTMVRAGLAYSRERRIDCRWHACIGIGQAKLKPARIFKDAIELPPPVSPGPNKQQPEPRQITGIAFDDRGDQVLTAAEDETFRLYNCKTGKQVPLEYTLREQTTYDQLSVGL